MAKILCLAILSLILSWSCSGPARSVHTSVTELISTSDSVYRPKYARGFVIHYLGDDKIVEVANPWDSTQASDYFFIDNSGTVKLESIPSIKAPVLNWSAFSSTQVIMADVLDVLQTLKSVAEPEYISNEFVKQGLSERLIRNVGMASSPDMEVLLLSNPQFVFVSPFKDNQYEQLKEAGLVVIPDAGYLENVPLGRVEWLVFFGAFFNREADALRYFASVEQQYFEAVNVTSSVSVRPSVTTGYLFQDVWFLPAGESFLAELFRDAGAAYPYANVSGRGSLAYDFEKVFFDCHECDYWVLTINHPDTFTYDQLHRMDERYAGFSAYKNRKVIYSNTAYSMFFEKAWIEPHIILKDLSAYLHPGLFDNHQPVYFNLLK
ncbi:ABC transporter substrate-binding protein [Alkaliflexus imshenetskii]|jgi:iron complex transport system substrate-binding protein|uniref:ABC transporter substrate-binding protein n=1 Tax=Alkaliflexus imshenetskii TaxID=286730 RepID=UPI00047872BB|nr:ABC transporter substrate-binding protein [Alkaliflexus imshenetskii]